MPTVNLHSDLSKSNIITEPTAKLPIHAHHAINSALPKLMVINIPGRLGDDERSSGCNRMG